MQKMQVGLLALCLGCGTPPTAVDAGTRLEDASTVLPSDPQDGGEPAVDGGSDVHEPDAGVSACQGKKGLSGNGERSFQSAGRKRKIFWHVPPAYDGSEPVPLLFSFHGVFASVADIRERTRFDEISDVENFIVVYPEGLNQSWNAGICCGLSQATRVNDVQFVRDVLALMEEEFCIDSKRIYASGFSNGGFMTHRLGCELSDRLAAIGVGSGQMGGFDCQPKRAVPVVQAHGTLDPIVLIVGNPATGFPSTDQVLTDWANRNGCIAAPDVSELTGVKPKVEYRRWKECRDNAEVHYYVVEGGTHDWFGNKTWSEPDAFKSSLVFWEFFKQHRLP